MINNKIRQKIEESLANYRFDGNQIQLEHPANLSHGDYSTNIALILAKKENTQADELAHRIVKSIQSNLPKEVEKIEVKGPGFINFSLSRGFYVSTIKQIIEEKNNFGKNTLLKGKKIMIEYTNPNPFKEFHIGHLMNNAIGESISRIFWSCGAILVRANYQGDVGMHIAKTIWGLIQKDNPYPKNILELGEAYTFGSIKFNEDEHAKKEIVAINKKIYSQSDETINNIYKHGRKLSLEHLEEIYSRLGTKFEHYFFESEIWKLGAQIVNEHIADGVFDKSDGAIVFRGEQYGLHTRVFINSEGITTYEAKELGLNKNKFDVIEDLDQSYIVAANEQKEYFKVVLKVLGHLYPNIAEKTQHIAYGMLRFASGKMSSRKGNIITAESLIYDVKKLVKQKMRGGNLADQDKEKISEEVALGAIKYSILKQNIGKDIIFDFGKSISFEGDSGPYLQYSRVRAISVLNKAKNEQLSHDYKNIPDNVTTLEKLLYRFPEIVERAYYELSPSYIVTYLTELAAAFNGYYAENKIVDSEDKNSPYKIAITKAFSEVMFNGMYLLGMEAPNKM